MPKRSATPKDVFHKGDKVEWSSHSGTAKGVVEGTITEDTVAANRVVRASKENPQYRVRTEKGREAVHKPSALRHRQ